MAPKPEIFNGRKVHDHKSTLEMMMDAFSIQNVYNELKIRKFLTARKLDSRSYKFFSW